jgi:PPP family 3-phenylpropionic acid transporter
MAATLIAWRHSSFYLFYFATLGVMLPYWSLYLQSLGFSPQQIGELLAITMATKLIAPYVWGWIVDHRGHRMTIIRLACFATFVSFGGVYVAGASFLGLLGVMLLFSFFWNAALPQFEATTLDYLAENPHRYSIVRVWGSIGFVATAVSMGMAIQPLGIGVIPATLLILFAGLWMASLAIPERAVVERHTDQRPILRVVARPRVVALLVICFLAQASHGPYYAFYSIYLKELGHSGTVIGLLWGLGVFAEVLIFLMVP